MEKSKYFEPGNPSHMDKWARNARLADWLVSMGFFVERVLDDKRPDSIDHLIVSVSLPEKLPHVQDQG
jgi:hypothetical protein